MGIEKFVKGQTRTSNSPLKRTKRDILRKPKNWIKKLWHIEDFVNMQSLLFLSESKRSDGKKAGGFLIPSDTISLFPFREGMRKKSEKIRSQKSLRFPLGIPHYIFSYPTKPLYFLVFQHLSYSLSGERRGKRRKEWEVSLYLLSISKCLMKSPVWWERKREKKKEWGRKGERAETEKCRMTWQLI